MRSVSLLPCPSPHPGSAGPGEQLVELSSVHSGLAGCSCWLGDGEGPSHPAEQSLLRQLHLKAQPCPRDALADKWLLVLSVSLPLIGAVSTPASPELWLSPFVGHREEAQGFLPAHRGISPTPGPPSALAGEEHQWLPKPLAGGIAASPRLDLLLPSSHCTEEQMETFGPSDFGSLQNCTNMLVFFFLGGGWGVS